MIGCFFSGHWGMENCSNLLKDAHKAYIMPEPPQFRTFSFGCGLGDSNRSVLELRLCAPMQT
jgi:hypothetical protein